MPIQLSWGHFIELIGLDDGQERLFYQHKAIINSWGVRELRRQTRRRLYQNTSKIDIEETFKAKLPATQPYEIFRDTYDFNFIDLRSDDHEKDLESKILDCLEMFLKELGEDFSISGRQVPIKIDRKTHYIDLVLYHKGIPCNLIPPSPSWQRAVFLASLANSPLPCWCCKSLDF